MRMKIALCGHLGLLDEAQRWVERLRELQPAAAVTASWAIPAGMISPAYRSKILEGLRKAGLPER